MAAHLPVPDFGYRSAEASCSHALLWPRLRALLTSLVPPPASVVELGCGNGATARALCGLGYRVTAIDASPSGIAAAARACPDVDFRVASVYDDLPAALGTFDAALSLEVIEHLYAPSVFLNTVLRLLRDGGTFLISTPYHGYLKNLAIAIAGRHDRHVSPLWEGGHIKFFSKRTLAHALRESGFTTPRFVRVGRIPPLAKSMLAVCSRPPASPPGPRGAP